MTWRGTAFVLACIAVIAFGAASPSLYGIGLVLVAMASAAVIIDSRRAPGRARLRVARTCDDLLSLGVANRVSLHVDTGARACHVVVRDEVPPVLHPSATRWRARTPVAIEYTLIPRARGDAELGRTVIRADGPWRLGWRQTTLGEPRTVRTDANLSAVSIFESLARRGQLAELGLRTIRMRTEGSEFERIREAVPDDPLRAINWRATARTGRLMAVELIPERAQPLVICLDHGRLMGIGAGELTKLDHAINAALLLVHVALRSGDRVGVLAFADTVTATLPPRSGTAQLRRFLDVARPLVPGETEADYDEALGFLSRWQSRRCLAVIFTDVLDPDQGAALVRQCARLRRRHLPLVVTVRDPALVDAVRATPLRGEDVYSRAVAGGVIADREATVRLLQRAGVETIDADARTLSPQLVNRYLDLKRSARL